MWRAVKGQTCTEVTGLTGGPGGPGGPFGPSRPRGPCERKEKEDSGSAQGPGPLPDPRQIVRPRSAPSPSGVSAVPGRHAAQGACPTPPPPPASPPPPTPPLHLSSGRRRQGCLELMRGSDRRSRGALRERGAFQLDGCPSHSLRAGEHKSPPAEAAAILCCTEHFGAALAPSSLCRPSVQ